MLVGFQNDMRKLSIDHPDEMLTVQNVNFTHSLTVFDYSYESDEVFWCDIGLRSVFKSSINDRDGYNREAIRDLHNTTMINGLAIDWIYKHVYYTHCWVCITYTM